MWIVVLLVLVAAMLLLVVESLYPFKYHSIAGFFGQYKIEMLAIQLIWMVVTVPAEKASFGKISFMLAPLILVCFLAFIKIVQLFLLVVLLEAYNLSLWLSLLSYPKFRDDFLGLGLAIINSKWEALRFVIYQVLWALVVLQVKGADIFLMILPSVVVVIQIVWLFFEILEDVSESYGDEIC